MSNKKSTLSDRAMNAQLEARDARNLLTGGAKQTRVKERARQRQRAKRRPEGKGVAERRHQQRALRTAKRDLETPGLLQRIKDALTGRNKAKALRRSRTR